MNRPTKLSAQQSYPLFTADATRAIEQLASACLPNHTLMQRAGLAAAQWTLALAPHAQHIWVACGPGNNGGDGFETALMLHRLGKKVSITWTEHAQNAGPPARRQAADASASRQRALAAGLEISGSPPAHFDVAIDALLGLGASLTPERAGTALVHQWLERMHSSGAPVLALDLPSGLDADTGNSGLLLPPGSQTAGQAPAARYTLSFLTLKPGLFTAQGRDLAGQVWLADLAVSLPQEVPPCAWLLGADRVSPLSRHGAAQASHKGSFGDVAVLGGDKGMGGAALLAGCAALHAGAGRVFVALLTNALESLDMQQPELMFRSPDALDFKRQVLVCGCGGGQAVRAHLPGALSSARKAVLDADALNAIANDTQLQTQLIARHGRGYATVLTPHPLEAARLLQCSVQMVQANRLSAAQALADRFACVVVLKGSGSVIAAPGLKPLINQSGNALLATAGTGDVLAGMVGAALAIGHTAWEAAASAVFSHGRLADMWTQRWPGDILTASALARRAGA